MKAVAVLLIAVTALVAFAESAPGEGRKEGGSSWVAEKEPGEGLRKGTWTPEQKAAWLEEFRAKRQREGPGGGIKPPGGGAPFDFGKGGRDFPAMPHPGKDFLGADREKLREEMMNKRKGMIGGLNQVSIKVVDKPKDCDRKSKVGDTLAVHYTVRRESP